VSPDPQSGRQVPGQPSARWLTRGVFGIGVSSLFSDLGHEAATSVLPVLLAAMGAPAFALGLIEGIADGLSSFAKLAGGWMADRPRWRKVIAGGGYLITGLSTFAYGFAQSWPLLLIARALGWAGRGAKGPSRDALLSDAVAPNQVGRAFGFERSMDTLGAVMGPLLALAMVHYVSVPLTLRWTLIPGVLATLTFFFFVPSGRTEKHHQPLAFFHSLRQLPERYRRLLTGIFVFGLGDFAHTLLILRAAQILLPRYGAVRAGMLAVMLYTVHNIIYAAASYPAGALGDRMDKRSLLAFGYAAGAAMNVGFIFLPGNLGSLALLFALAGIAIAIHDAIEKAAAADVLPSEIRGTGYGVLAAVNGVGDFVSSAVVGLLWSAVNPAAGFIYAAVLTAGGSLVIWRGRR
jgi:MFS family permease